MSDAGVGQVLYRECPPPPDLAPSIECVWHMRIVGAPGNGTAQRVLPDGRVELVLNLADPFAEVRSGLARVQPLDLLVGPTSRHMAIRPTGEVDLVGIRLRPGAARSLVAEPMVRLRDRSGAIGDLGGALAGLRERVGQETDVAGRTRTVWEVLRRAVRARRIDARTRAACEAIGRSAGNEPVAAVADRVGVSPRTLHRLLLRDVGVAPKTLSALVRFQDAMGRMSRSGRPHEPQAWLAAGYCDQSHFLRDFRRFAGTSPGGFFQDEDNTIGLEFTDARD